MSDAPAIWADELLAPANKIDQLYSRLAGGENFDEQTDVQGYDVDPIWGFIEASLAPTGGPMMGRHLRRSHVTLFQAASDELLIGSFEPVLSTQREILRVLENIRGRLDLTADTMASLLGLRNRRRYYDWLGGVPMPLSRLNAALGAASALMTLIAENPQVAKRVFDEEQEDASKLIATGRFASFRALVNRVRAEHARELEALAPTLPFPTDLPSDITPGAFADSVKSGAFRAATAILERLAPQTRVTSEVWRVEAFAELQAMLDARRQGEELPESWVFLVALDGAGTRELRERATAKLSEPSGSREAWEAFLAEEAGRAWATYDFTIAEPLEEEEDDTVRAGSPGGLFDFTSLGIDLVTGKQRRDG